MAMQSEKRGGFALSRGGSEVAATEKPKEHQEMGLFVAFVILLGWAVYVGLHGVNWSAIGHTFSSLLAWIG